MMKKKKWLRLAFLPLVMTLGLSNAQAADGIGGISLGGTRLIFDGSKDAASMTVTNSSVSDVWLMRFWVSPYGEKSDDAAEKKEAMPFAVTPPLYRLDQKSAVQLRVNKLADNLPADRESVYYLNNLAIPPKKGEKSYQKAVQSGLQFAVNTRIKLFYRPAAISNADVVKAAPEKLTASISGKTLLVKNPTPYYITLTQLAVDGKAAQTDKDTMVSPFGVLSIPASATHGTLSYHTVDDRGMTTPVIEKRF
ncbi:fimbrial biogenesis chaperone [Yersinia enterocolitica]|nr:molecular chaperone [Yersinia enterocolitica]EKN5104597.1 molecular chaperone [Yersinia enterocolitica]